MEPDGLPMRDSGEWVKTKHHYLDRYCRMFTVGMKNKWRSLTYLDLLAGPGRCEIRTTHEILPGSPFVALQHGFSGYQFYESDPVLASALSARVACENKAELCTIYEQRWEEAVLAPDFLLPSSLILAFVDPTGISQVPWTAMERLARSSRYIDILMTIQHGMGIRLNRHQYSAKTDGTAVDAFLGGSSWRGRLENAPDFCTAVLEEYVERMQSLQFQTRKWMLVKTGTGADLYYLCLFSRHPKALQFWDQVVLKDVAGQRAMDI